MSWKKICTLFLVGLAVVAAVRGSFADEKPFRLGIIGLDTSHVSAFTNYMNDPANKTGCKVVAAYRGGSAGHSGLGRPARHVYEAAQGEVRGVEIVDSIEELCKKVDGVLAGKRRRTASPRTGQTRLRGRQAGLYRQAGGRKPCRRGRDIQAIEGKRRALLDIFDLAFHRWRCRRLKRARSATLSAALPMVHVRSSRTTPTSFGMASTRPKRSSP